MLALLHHALWISAIRSHRSRVWHPSVGRLLTPDCPSFCYMVTAHSRNFAYVGTTNWNRLTRKLRVVLLSLSLSHFRKRLMSVLLDSDFTGSGRERRFLLMSDYKYNYCYGVFAPTEEQDV